MSNYLNNYLLLDILNLLDEKYNFFNNLSYKTISNTLDEIIKIGEPYNIDKKFIFKSIGKTYNICASCYLPVKILHNNGLCSYCINSMNGNEDTFDNIVLKEEDIDIISFNSGELSDLYVGEIKYLIHHKKTNYKTKTYYLKEDAIIELKRYLNGDILE